MLRIMGSVGVGGKNHAADVKAVQAALNRLLWLIVPIRPIIENGSLGARPDDSLTVTAIEQFQTRVVGLRSPDRRIDVNGRTHLMINARLRALGAPSGAGVPEPRWMAIAKGELGQAEVAGKKANPRILEYFKASKFWGTDDSGSRNAWCASFVSWVMAESGYTAVSAAFRAKAWSSFGKAVSGPVYGAIGVKTRKGGGHVAFVVGQSEDGRHLYMLGGNQSDQVRITRYPVGAWRSFRVPADYDTSQASLPIYSKPAANAGAED